MAEFQDKKLICKDCGVDFVWTANEQRFYKDKGLQNVPGRCQGCREDYKKFKTDERPKRLIKCSKCPKTDELRFLPQEGETVLCGTCFKEKKETLGMQETKFPLVSEKPTEETKSAESDKQQKESPAPIPTAE